MVRFTPAAPGDSSTGADAWTRVSIDDAAVARQGRLDRLAEGATKRAYAIGTLIPEFWEPPAALEAAQLQAARAGDLARFEALSIEAENWAREQGLGGVASGFLLTGSDGARRRVETGSEEELRDILVEPSGEVWAVGTNGVILNGDPATGTLTDRSRLGDRDRDFVSITRFEGRMVLCSDSALHWFDGQILTPMLPMPGLGIDCGTSVPLTMRAVGHSLLYFDREHGVHRFTLALHWTVASTTLLLWPLGQFTDSLPRGPIRANVWSLHVALGFVFAGALAALFVWRQTGGRQLAVPETEPFHRLAKAVHVPLYVLAAGVALLGIANAFIRGVSLFDLVQLPRIGDREWRPRLTDLHGLAAHGLAVPALFHAAAALVHHDLWHDQVLRRMLPRRVSRR